MGSFRRGAATCGDVDVLLTHPTFTSAEHKAKRTGKHVANVVEALKSAAYLKEDLSHGKLKYMGFGTRTNRACCLTVLP